MPQWMTDGGLWIDACIQKHRIQEPVSQPQAASQLSALS